MESSLRSKDKESRECCQASGRDVRIIHHRESLDPFLKQSLATAQAEPSPHLTMREKGLNSESYSGSGLARRVPPTSPRGRLICSGKLYVNGWIKSVTLHSALPPENMLRLCG
jgi:hypothetical protein